MDIFVFMSIDGQDVRIGTLHQDVVRGNEVFSFEYEKSWLQSRLFTDLDPDLGQYAGQQYVGQGKPNFGVFLDSAPDRWGRTLINRREGILARAEHRRERSLYEADYLLGVYDGNRMGALRFKTQLDGPYLDDSSAFSAPPLAMIRDLEQASLSLEEEGIYDDSSVSQWLRMLLAPGSSLGGARPKANILDKNGSLWIAKFPSKNDSYDKGAWEHLACSLAHLCGIAVPVHDIVKYSGYHTFLSRRFDRELDRRIHFTSAMTVLGASDGQESYSYLDLADFIIRKGYQTDLDLKELWRRMMFNIAISNCDDHLRNHGFLLTKKGWKLSPAFDLNPDPKGAGLQLNIDDSNNSLDFRLGLEVAPFFRIKKSIAEKELEHIRTVVSKWRSLANSFKISRYEQDYMASAFRY